MATIQQRKTADGETHYRVLVRIKGCPTQTATFRRKTDATRWAQQLEADIRRGQFFQQQEAQRHTLAELVDAYLADAVARLSESDRVNRRRHLAWWSKRLGSFRLSDLRPSVIVTERRVLARKGLRGNPASAATQNRYLASLSATLTYGVRELEWLESNPIRNVPRQKEPRGRMRFLSDEERGRLLDSCARSRDPRLQPLVMMAISTGMRRSELLRLTWADIDLDRQVAIVHDSKNGTRRAVPVPHAAFDSIDGLSAGRQGTSSPIFANQTGKAQFPKKPWMEALEEAEIEAFTFHDCRHTAASYLAMSGATLAEIADILGHKTLQMVKRYAHLSEQHTVAVSQRMADRFLG